MRVAAIQSSNDESSHSLVSKRFDPLTVRHFPLFFPSLLFCSGNLALAATAAAVGAGAVAFYFTTKDIQRARPKGSSVANPVAGPRKYLIGGNWKSNGTYEENVERIKMFNEAGPIPDNVEVVLCVPYVHIPMVLSLLREDIEVGAQNCGNNTADGAYTGEVGAHMLKDIGCSWVIIGHSERREGFGMAGEPEALCAEKCKIALDKGLKVMFAIGEKKEERESGVTMKVCAKQLEPLAKLLEPKDWANGTSACVFDGKALF